MKGVAHGTAAGLAYSRSPEGRAHLERLRAEVRAYQPPGAEPPPRRSAPEPEPARGKEAAAGRDAEPITEEWQP
jgi:hypothetical protein